MARHPFLPEMFFSESYPAGIYLLKVNNRNTRERCERCSKLTIKISESLSFTESNTPPWVFFTFFELHKWYQIAQHITDKITTGKLGNSYLSENIGVVRLLFKVKSPGRNDICNVPVYLSTYRIFYHYFKTNKTLRFVDKLSRKN